MRVVVKVVLCVLFLPVAAAAALLAREMRVHMLYDDYHEPLAKTLSVRSTSFAPDGDMPEIFTCHGHGDSPDIRWTRAPANTKSFAITMLDWDVPTPLFPLHVFTHWIVYDIPVQRNDIPAAIAPVELPDKSMTAGTNSFGALGYVPPCPPHGRHRYAFRVYALDTPQLHPAQSDRLSIEAAMHGHVLAYGEAAGFVRH